MSKIALIGIDTAKNVFHLVGTDEHRSYTYRKKLSRQRLLPVLGGFEACEVVLEACAASHPVVIEKILAHLDSTVNNVRNIGNTTSILAITYYRTWHT